MKWPWGTEFTDQQAVETAKYLLSLSQAAMIGAVGTVFVLQLDFIVRILFSVLGFMLGIFLYLFSMRLLREVNSHEYYIRFIYNYFQQWTIYSYAPYGTHNDILWLYRSYGKNR